MNFEELLEEFLNENHEALRRLANKEELTMNYVTVNKDGAEVHEGDEVVDFRGTPATFVRATRARTPGKSGKVLARYEGQQQSYEYYDKVFDLTVQEA